MTVGNSFGNRPIGEIAATLPGATGVFRRFKLDFCCGGGASLTEAAAKRRVDIAAVEDALAALATTHSAPGPEATSSVLIAHIVRCYHEPHRRELPELVRLARKIEAVHADHPQTPHGLGDALEAMRSDLEKHMRYEETDLFPSMQQPNGSGATVDVRHDHRRQGEHLRKLEAITGGFALPAGACRSWEALYLGTAKLVDDVMEHIHLENNVLFPRYEQHEPART